MNHNVGDLVLHKAHTLRNTLGYIKKIKAYREYEVYWFNPYLKHQDDISLESDASINSLKRNLQEYMDEHHS
jgi:hypothetical protein